MSHIRYIIEGDLCFVRLTGAILHPQALDFDALVQHVCRVGGPRQFVFDLTETEYMDSTILGVLATVARWASEQGLEPPILASPSADVAMVLSSMGFEHYFTIGDFRQQPDPTNLRSAPPVSSASPPKAQVLLDAHRALMAMNAKNRDEFRDVEQLLAQDVSLSSEAGKGASG
jgi:anti-anti-sigma factor